MGTAYELGARSTRSLLVEDVTITMSEVSFLLGYAEPTAFYRAFRRSTGEA